MRASDLYLAIRKRFLILLRGKHFVTRRSGCFFLVDIFNLVDRHIEAYGLYEREQITKFSEMIASAKSEILIDIGANSGMYSIIVGSRYPGIIVHAFEPDRRNVAQLYGNLFINDLQDRINVYSCALSDINGTLSFSRFSDENRGRSAIDESGELVVETRRLDDVIAIKGKRIAIKIDVEGHEYSVIQGATQTLMNNDCVLQVESFVQDDQLLETMTSLGYRKVASIESDHYYVRQNPLVQEI